ncbi:hypothetical protein BH20ACI3_BH20ACI3_07160 [soil metagenome]
MSTASSEIHDLARRLLAFEAAHDNSFDAGMGIAAQVIEELRVHLIRFAGVDGFRSLLSRALMRARAEAPSLNMVHVCADGSLEGFVGSDQSQAEQAGISLVAHLLELLMTFIGEPLTLRLVRDACPGASMDRANLTTEEKP